MRGNQVYFVPQNKGPSQATVSSRRSDALICSELFEDLGGDVIPLSDTEVECQRAQDVYSFVQNNKDMDISPVELATIGEMII